MANLTHPGKPNYAGPKMGLFTCIHHEELIEWSSNIMERIQCIRDCKPQHERAVRLASIVLVSSDHPDLPYEIRELYRATPGTTDDLRLTRLIAVLDSLLHDTFRTAALKIVRQLIPKGNWVERKDGISGLKFPKAHRSKTRRDTIW